MYLESAEDLGEMQHSEHPDAQHAVEDDHGETAGLGEVLVVPRDDSVVDTAGPGRGQNHDIDDVMLVSKNKHRRTRTPPGCFD